MHMIMIQIWTATRPEFKTETPSTPTLSRETRTRPRDEKGCFNSTRRLHHLRQPRLMECTDPTIQENPTPFALYPGYPQQVGNPRLSASKNKRASAHSFTPGTSSLSKPGIRYSKPTACSRPRGFLGNTSPVNNKHEERGRGAERTWRGGNWAEGAACSRSLVEEWSRSVQLPMSPSLAIASLCFAFSPLFSIAFGAEAEPEKERERVLAFQSPNSQTWLSQFFFSSKRKNYFYLDIFPKKFIKFSIFYQKLICSRKKLVSDNAENK